MPVCPLGGLRIDLISSILYPLSGIRFLLHRTQLTIEPNEPNKLNERNEPNKPNKLNETNEPNRLNPPPAD
jgi:hypothetical protein